MGNCQKSRITSRHQIANRYHSFYELNIRKTRFRINDFDDDTLLNVFSMLTLREKLAIERVCKRWQQLIRILLQNSVSLKMGEHSIKCHCHCIYWTNYDFPPLKSFERDKSGYIIYPNSILKHLMCLCTNLKCINLSHCYLDDYALKIIMTYSDQLECLHLYDIRLQDNIDNIDNINNSTNHEINDQINDQMNYQMNYQINDEIRKHNQNNLINNKQMNGKNNTNDFNYLIQWKMFSKKLGHQLKYLSIGGLTAMDQLAIDMLLKYCHNLDELKINNEIDIISYLAIIRHNVKRIYVDCEHGIGLECVSLLAFRNYAEKVINLGRVDVPPELMDSVISTIGSNFSNLKCLSLRLRHFDIDVSTPADFLFDQLEELSLQFVSGNVDLPFQKIISLGWSSIKCLTIQYASLKRESVAAISLYLPQLDKLVLHAVEFRCDHLSKRYGHRLCVECGRHCWQSIAQLPQLRHLRLHRVIIDTEICTAVNSMPKLRTLDLHYCSNVNENIIEVCTKLAKKIPRERFTLCIVSRGFLSFANSGNNNNFILDIRVALRNALKSTTSQSFNLSLISAEPKAIKICELLRQTRNQLIESMTDPSTDQSLVEQQLIKYLSLLQGFIASHHLDHRYGPNDSSKLRHYITFKWTNSLLGSTPEVQQDSIFELISISYEYAIWLMKHSSQLAAKQDISMDEAKQVHKCLRKAAGVLTQLKNNWFDRLLHKKFEPGSDLDHRVANCYIITCQAEAQEVTIGRAIELKHSSTLISGLANETSKLFLESASAIKTLDQTKFGKWITYLQLKSAFYESYAFCYLGQSLLEQEKCGEAIRALEESEKFYEIAVKLCKDYTKIKSIGTSAKIDEHLFFRKLRPLVTRIKDKCIRENGFIFHQKVPKECPALELKATHGLVTPEEFIIPPIHELWTPESYSAFDLSKNINLKDTANSKATAAEDPLPPVDEKPIKSNGSDPKNESGCRIQ